MKKSNKIVIYQAKNGSLELQADYSQETILASLDQISVIFCRDKSVISRHIKNVFKEEELKIYKSRNRILVLEAPVISTFLTSTKVEIGYWF